MSLDCAHEQQHTGIHTHLEDRVMRTVKRTWTAMIVLLLTIVLSAGYDAAVQADTLSGLADVTVVDGAILSIRHADA